MTDSYNRALACDYAVKWALGRNPKYYNFDLLGGDCTNFVSQCLYAGGYTMNDSENGWFYHSLNSRAPAWTSAQYLHGFLFRNRGVGPRGEATTLLQIQPGDIVQLVNSDGRIYHSLFVLSNFGGKVYIAAHTLDALFRPLDSYAYSEIIPTHIVCSEVL